MECNRIWDLISLYVDGEALEHEVSMVEAHVSACAECAADLAMLQRAAEAIAHVPMMEPPAALRQSILNATIYRPSAVQRFWQLAARALAPMPARYALTAAAGAMAVFGFMRLAPEATVTKSPTVVASTETARPKAGTAPVIADQPAPPTRLSEIPVLRSAEVPKTTGAKLALAGSSGLVRRAPLPNFGRITATGLPSGRTLETRDKGGVVSLIPTTTVDEKVKLPTNPSEEPLPDVIPPDVMEMMMKNGMMGEMGMMETAKKPVATEPMATNTGTTKIVLAASARVSPGQLATLADLKSSLKRSAADQMNAGLPQTAKERAIKVDVLKGSF